MISYMKEAIERLREWKKQRSADEAAAREAEAEAKAKKSGFGRSNCGQKGSHRRKRATCR